jgi:hypothetical protein
VTLTFLVRLLKAGRFEVPERPKPAQWITLQAPLEAKAEVI